jgi:hypothetical protein
MAAQRVKLKFSNGLPLVLVGFAIASSVASWAGLFPASLVETWYSRTVYPVVSSLITVTGRLTGSSMMDVVLPGAALLFGYLVYRRRVLWILGVLATGYLIFFWTWGVNYHRQPIQTKVDFQPDRVTDEAVLRLAQETAAQLNRGYLEIAALGPDGNLAGLSDEVDARVRFVIEAIDGVGSASGSRQVMVKSSRLLNPFFRAGTVDGMFNPFGHEALVTSGLLSFERPMVAAHEIAHVRGYAHEGEANFVALLAAVGSTNPRLRYSGWLTLWRYLRSPENEQLLEAGPLEDLEAVDERIRSNRVEWVSRTQTRTLDTFLRANRVAGGVRSYAQIVTLAVGTRHDWERFQAP